MDIRKFATRDPDPCDVFAAPPGAADDVPGQLQEARDAVVVALRLFEDDTRAVHAAERRVARFVSSWRGVDARLASIMDEILLLGTEMNQVFETGHVEEVQSARDSVRGLRAAFADLGSRRLGEAVGECRGAFQRREFMRDGVFGEMRKETLCPICMAKELSAFMVPCGHAVCSYCAEQVSDKCFVCRGAVSSKNKLYIQ